MTPGASSDSTKLRWGILSTAGIGRRNWRAMRDSDAATLVAVASREIGKADSFIDGMQAEVPWPTRPLALSYEDLLARPDVDAVYIPLPTGLRKAWVIRAAEAGKHVLCEKPCAVSAADLREMIAACERHGVRFMDGVMFMHDPRFAKLRELLDDGETVGEIKRLTSVFSFRGGDDFASSNIRGRVDLEPTGCLGDLGWYCLRGFLWAMNWQLPRRVSCRALGETSDPDGKPAITDFSGELDFENGVTAAFHCSFHAPGQAWLNISGSKGSVRVPDFVSPSPECDTDYEIGYRRIIRSTEPRLSNEARMFQCFASLAGDCSRASNWPEISLLTQQLMDACAASAKSGQPFSLQDGEYAPWPVR